MAATRYPLRDHSQKPPVPNVAEATGRAGLLRGGIRSCKGRRDSGFSDLAVQVDEAFQKIPRAHREAVSSSNFTINAFYSGVQATIQSCQLHGIIDQLKAVY